MNTFDPALIGRWRGTFWKQSQNGPRTILYVWPEGRIVCLLGNVADTVWADSKLVVICITINFTTSRACKYAWLIPLTATPTSVQAGHRHESLRARGQIYLRDSVDIPFIKLSTSQDTSGTGGISFFISYRIVQGRVSLGNLSPDGLFHHKF